MHRTYLGLALATALVVTGCSDAVTGAGQSGSSAPTSSAAPASSTPVPTTASSAAPIATGAVPPASSGAPSSGSGAGGFPTDLDALGNLLLKGGQSIKSAHLELSENAGSTSISGAGDESLSNGKVQAIDLAESVGTTKLRFIIVAGNVYAQLPPALYPAKKPWVEITAATTNTQLQSLYASFQSSLQSGATDTARFFVTAGKNLQLKGTTELDGTLVAHYAVTVDIASLPSDFPNRAALTQSGLATIPVELYIDAQGHTRKLTENFSVAGQSVSVEVTLTKIDQPVTISAPPADQVEHA